MLQLTDPYWDDDPAHALCTVSEVLSAVSRVFWDDQAPDLTDKDASGICTLLSCLSNTLETVTGNVSRLIGDQRDRDDERREAIHVMDSLERYDERVTRFAELLGTGKEEALELVARVMDRAKSKTEADGDVDTVPTVPEAMTARDLAIAATAREGYPTEEIAKAVNLKKQTVEKIIARLRDDGTLPAGQGADDTPLAATG